VGGSHEPILRAIEELRPAYTCFLCTGRDPATRAPGSRIQIEGRGKVIHAARGDSKLTLPAIRIQAGIEADAYQVIEVPADDMDGAYALAARAIAELGARFPDAAIHADYTGGTKTMSAALVLAALDAEPPVALHLVSGARADLERVRRHTERGAPANVARIRLRRRMAPFLDAWARYAYDEAAAGLAAIAMPADADARGTLLLAGDLSAAFAAWDRFDHAAALERLFAYRNRIGRDLNDHLGALGYLTRDCPEREPLRLLDLWHNAERRAVQGRYDDAVARAYRLIEWSAQWLLDTRLAIKTADIPAERVPAGVNLEPDRDGKRKAGLYLSWSLIGHWCGESPAGAFFAAARDELRHHLQARNASILAHGFAPIDAGVWTKLHGWLDTAFLPMLREEIKLARIRAEVPQLPARYLWDD